MTARLLALTVLLLTALTAPAHATAETCGIIGDSNTAYMGEPVLRDALTATGRCGGGLYFYGQSGKKLLDRDDGGTTTLEDITAARRQLGHVDNWIIALGTNSLALDNTTFQRQVNTVLNAIAPVRNHETVEWVDVTFYRPHNVKADVKNPLIASACRARSGWCSYLPWDAYIHAPGVFDPADWLAPDDTTHMTAAGYVKRAAFIAGRCR